MAKFVIECPRCGNYAQGRTGFFSRKRIDCACGHVIDVRMEKLASRRCPHCGNDVVYDQTKGDRAKCPVCGELINTQQIQEKMVEFYCQQCGVLLSASKEATSHTCPVCDCVNDVAQRAASQKLRQEEARVIKYEGDNDTLVWKHPAEDFAYGSQLIVHESQEAVFLQDGQAVGIFGAGRYSLNIQQMPMLGQLAELAQQPGATFHSEVYFINMATHMGIKWGTDTKVGLFDPASGLHVELGASGEFNIRVTNSRKLLLRLVGTTDGLSQSALVGGTNTKGLFRSLVMTQVRSLLAQVIKANRISVLELDERLVDLSAALRERINETMYAYGLEITEFFVSRIVTPDDNPDFKKMKEQFAAEHLLVREEEIRRKEAEAAGERKAVEARNQARMKVIGAQGDAEALLIVKQAEAEAYRLKAEAEAKEMHMKGYTYQQETARQVSLEAVKNGSGSGVLGEMAGLGMTLGAMGSVASMTREAMAPAVQSMQPGAGDAGWSCSCGQSNITSRFCPECGSPKPAQQTGWTCPSCGKEGITSRFCPDCGARKPENTAWTCPECGAGNITSKFCPECGHKRA